MCVLTEVRHIGSVIYILLGKEGVLGVKLTMVRQGVVRVDITV